MPHGRRRTLQTPCGRCASHECVAGLAICARCRSYFRARPRDLAAERERCRLYRRSWLTPSELARIEQLNAERSRLDAEILRLLHRGRAVFAAGLARKLKLRSSLARSRLRSLQHRGLLRSAKAAARVGSIKTIRRYFRLAEAA